MVKHIILWNLKDDISNIDDVKKGIKTNLEGLFNQIPGLLEINVQTECLESSTADVMLYSVFENKEALKNYSVHPKHVEVADNFIRPYTKTRSCIDFEI